MPLNTIEISFSPYDGADHFAIRRAWDRVIHAWRTETATDQRRHLSDRQAHHISRWNPLYLTATTWRMAAPPQ
jgi:hypothetical protein